MHGADDGTAPAQTRAGRIARPALALTLSAVAIALVATGALPAHDAESLAERVVPILLFVVGITVVTELAAEAGLFEWVSAWISRWGRGSTWAVWALVVVLAVTSTAFLSIDTTAVLVTPLVVVFAIRAGLSPIPFAMAAIWLANTASLVLPVSNLTNLLAADLLDRDTLGFLQIAWLPALVGIAVPVAVLSVRYRRDLGRRYVAPPLRATPDRPSLVVAGIVVALLIPALVSGVPVEYPALAAAAVLLAVTLIRRPRVLRPAMVPWFPVLVAGGLFVIVETLHSRGVTDGMLAAVAGDSSPAGLVGIAAAGALTANAIDNLPAYLVLEPAAHDPARLIALLVGVNFGAIVTPWASLATLLWHERLTALGVRVSWPRFMLAGLGLALVLVPLGALAAFVTAVR